VDRDNAARDKLSWERSFGMLLSSEFVVGMLEPAPGGRLKSIVGFQSRVGLETDVESEEESI
jgi:hypothetical protein